MKLIIQLAVVVAAFVVVGTDLRALDWLTYSNWADPVMLWPVAAVSWVAFAAGSRGVRSARSTPEARRAAGVLLFVGVVSFAILSWGEMGERSSVDVLRQAAPTAYAFVLAWGLLRDPRGWAAFSVRLVSALVAIAIAAVVGFDCGVSAVLEQQPRLHELTIPFCVAIVLYRLLEDPPSLSEH